MCDVINEAYQSQPGCTKEEHDIKLGILMDILEHIDWFKDSPYIQLKTLVGVLHELEQDKNNQTNEFAHLSPHN